MNEAAAQELLHQRYGAGKMTLLRELVASVINENARQNLIAPSTIESIWVRHVLDSAQLLHFCSNDVSSWLDVGSGAGFPGLVVAALVPTSVHVTMVEPRRRRADFLRRTAEALKLSRVTVQQMRVEQLLPTASADVISARAVASLDTLLHITTAHRQPSTVYVLPRGAHGCDEVEHARLTWHGLFHVEQSVTDVASTIVVAREVTPRCIGSR